MCNQRWQRKESQPGLRDRQPADVHRLADAQAPRASREGKAPTTCLAPVAAPSPCHDNEDPGQPSTGMVLDAGSNDSRQASSRGMTAMTDYLQAVFAMLGPGEERYADPAAWLSLEEELGRTLPGTTNRSSTRMRQCRSTATSPFLTLRQAGGTWARRSVRHQKSGLIADGSPTSLGRTTILASSANYPSSASEPPKVSYPSPPPIKELRSS